MTHSLIRSVAPTGHVYTFEFHESRCELARAEFERHVRSTHAASPARCSFWPSYPHAVAQGLTPFVTCFYGDAYANCFALLPAKVDAIFLDLPKPWFHPNPSLYAVPFRVSCSHDSRSGFAAFSQKKLCGMAASWSRSRPALNKYRSVCSPRFQSRVPSCSALIALLHSQRTAAQMRSVGFRDVRMFEILSRNMDCAPCEATAAILDEAACRSAPKQTLPIKRLREAAQSSAAMSATSIVSRPPKEEPGHTGYLLFGTLCLPPLQQRA
jgi:hypothetical protein